MQIYIVEDNRPNNEMTVEEFVKYSWIGIENEDLKAYILSFNADHESGFLLVEGNSAGFYALNRSLLVNKIRENFSKATFHIFGSSQELFKWMALID